MRRRSSVLESFNYAFEGIIHVLRTQRNMRIHFAIAFAVLVAAFASGVSRFELMALILAIAFVLIAEMVNTAVEHTIDVATTSFDPMAKLAKDIASGAVLIASGTAVAIGYLVFASRLQDPSARLIDRVRDAPVDLTLIALLVTVILVIATKAVSGRGTPLKGGSGYVQSAVFAPDGRTLVTRGLDGKVIVWEAATGKRLQEWVIHENVGCVAFAQERYDLVVYGGTAGGVMTAVSGAREGLKVALLEPGAHLGGMATVGRRSMASKTIKATRAIETANKTSPNTGPAERMM